MNMLNISRPRFFLALLIFLLLVPICAYGADAAQSNGIKIVFNGVQISSDVNPFIDQNSRTMVPLRFIAENLGASVDWRMETQTITVKHNGCIITLKIGSNRANVDNDTVLLDTQPVIQNSRTMVPLRFVSEQLGCLVSWNVNEQAVYINTKADVKQEVIVNVTTANIRQGPGTTYPVVSKVKSGTILGFISSSGGWYEVLLADNSRGWISGNIVKLITESEEEEENEDEREDDDQVISPEIDGDSVIFIANAVNIRQAPSTESEVIGQAYKSQELAAVGSQEDWIKVLTKEGQEGWVANWLVAYKKAPERRNGSLKGKIIVIDPGHGSLQPGGWSDPGAVSPWGLYERDIVTKISFTAGQVLSEEGATVIYTRLGNTSISLEGRAALANYLRADCFVAVHCNSSTNPAGSGTSTYYYAPEGMEMQQRLNRERLAALVQEELLESLGRNDLGILQASFVVLRSTTVPSILVETAFLSNQEEEALLRSAAFQGEAGEAIARGVIAYFEDE